MTTEWIDQGEVAAESQADPAMAVGEPRNPFLVALGERVRTLRSRQGMTRKAVARAADVSERHLANLEYGTGNASILVLLQVAQALHCTLAELLGDITTSSPEWLLIRELLEHRSEADLRRARQALAELLGAGGDARARHARIALIGLRGAGKSTLGKMLAKKIGWTFVELNKDVEQQNGLSVAEIIALYGQEGFRRMEQAALAQLLERKSPVVLATGGGIVSEPVTFDLVLSSFYTVWLRAAPEEHMGRVRKQGDLRPMADDRSAMQELRTILLSREPLYARASAQVDTAGLNVDEAAQRLADTVEPIVAKQSQTAAPRAVAAR